MNRYSRLVTQLRAKIAFIYILRHLLYYLSILSFIIASLVLVIRMFSLLPDLNTGFLLLGLSLAVIYSAYRGLKEMPDRRSLYAILDEQNECGGLLMSGQEVGIGDWKKVVREIRLPKIKWNYSRKLGIFAAAVFFMVFSYVVPANYVRPVGVKTLDIAEDVGDLNEKIDVLEEERLIEEQTAKELEEKLEQLKKDAMAESPAKTWESLDHIEQALKNTANEAAESSIAQTEKLSQMQMLAEMLSNSDNPSKLDNALLSDAMKELSSMMKSALMENQEFRESLSSDCLNACNNGSLSKEQLEELLKSLKSCKGKKSCCMGKLCKAGLIDAKKFKVCNRAGQCSSKGLLEFLKENGSCMGTCGALKAYCSCPGRGGVSRGRADAEMTWTNGSDENGALFKEQILPQASLEALRDSMLAGVSAGTPEVNTEMSAGGGGALNTAVSGSGEAFTQTILPKHRTAVKNYFERE